MYYTVYLTTEPDLKGKVKKFIVETNLNTQFLLMSVLWNAKDGYNIYVKEGRKGWKQYGILTLDELLKEVREFRFYRFVEKTNTITETKEGTVELPNIVRIEDVWRKEFSVDGVERTFIKFDCFNEYFTLDAEFLAEEFRRSTGIELKPTINPNIFFSLTDFKIKLITASYTYPVKYYKVTYTETTTSTEHVKEEI
jgi:hypothetical protein